MPAFVTKAVLRRPEAIDYVGGERIFEALMKHHPAVMKPFSQTPRGNLTFRVATLDNALAAAEAAGTLIEPIDPNKNPGKRNLRRH